MGFEQFNITNNYFNANNVNLGNFLTGAAAYFKTAPNIPVYQAYIRAVGSQAIQQAVTQIFNSVPAYLVDPRKRLDHRYRAVDVYWNMTATPGGVQQLANEQGNRQTYWTTGQGANAVPKLDEYSTHGVAQNHLQTLLVTPRQVSGYMALLTAKIAPYVPETPFCKYNQNHKHAVDTTNKIASLANHIAMGQLTEKDGAYKDADSKWIALQELANYWIKEIPNTASRSTTFNAINSYNGVGTNASLFRLVSEGEKNFVAGQQRPTVAQGPISYERHKWFFAKGGAPGVGHKHTLELKLRGDGWTFLYDRAQEVNDEAKSTSPFALVKKGNEHMCIGIHEELLSVFCQRMVSEIKVIS
jgi:hypothetical protein